MLPYAVAKFPLENSISVICTKWLDQDNKHCKYPTSKAESLNMSRILKKECDSAPDWENHPVSVLGLYETYAEAKRHEPKAVDTSNLSDDDDEIIGKRKRRPNSKYEDMCDNRSPSPPPKKSKTTPPEHPSLSLFSSPSANSSSHSCASPPNYPKPSILFQTHPTNNNTKASTSFHHSVPCSPYSDNDVTHQTPTPDQQQQTHHSSYPHDDYTHSQTHQTPTPDQQQQNHHSPYPHHDYTHSQSHQTPTPDQQQQTLHSPYHLHDFIPLNTHKTPTSHQQHQTRHSPYPLHDFIPSNTHQTPNIHQQQQTHSSPYHLHDAIPSNTHNPPPSRRQQPTVHQSRLQKPTSGDVLDKLNHLISMVAELNGRMDKVETHLALLTESRGINKENRPESEEIFTSLPFKTIEDFEEYEKKLTDDEVFRKSFVKAVSTLGGRDPNALTINIMKCLMTDKVAEKFSLTGKKMGNFPAKKKFSDTKLCISVFDAVGRRHKEVSNDVIKNTMKHWLQQATPRIQKRERRQAPAVVGEDEEV